MTAKADSTLCTVNSCYISGVENEDSQDGAIHFRLRALPLPYVPFHTLCTVNSCYISGENEDSQDGVVYPAPYIPGGLQKNPIISHGL
jgi:hypothetical protein